MKYLNLLLILSIFVFSSCVDDETIEDMILEQPNVMGFVENARNIGSVSNTGSTEFEFPVYVTGPSVDKLSGSYTATISVNANSTAVEGTHFSLPSNTFTLTADGGLQGLFTLTMLSDGVVTTPEDPLVSPKLILDVTTVDGSGNVVASGKQLTLTMDYLCNAVLGVQYVATHTTSTGTVYVHNDLIVETGLEIYRTASLERWGDGGVAPLGDGGFQFLNVCNEITIPNQSLMNYYSNQVAQAGACYVAANGDLYFNYSIVYSGTPATRTAVYVKQ